MVCSPKEFKAFDLKHAQRLQQLAAQLAQIREVLKTVHQTLQQPDGTVCMVGVAKFIL